jgi:hypothetical protein
LGMHEEILRYYEAFTDEPSNCCRLVVAALNESYQRFEELILLTPTWKEPSERLKDVKGVYNKLCSSVR